MRCSSSWMMRSAGADRPDLRPGRIAPFLPLHGMAANLSAVAIMNAGTRS